MAHRCGIWPSAVTLTNPFHNTIQVISLATAVSGSTPHREAAYHNVSVCYITRMLTPLKTNQSHHMSPRNPRVDPEGGGRGCAPPPPPWNITVAIDILRNTGTDTPRGSLYAPLGNSLMTNKTTQKNIVRYPLMEFLDLLVKSIDFKMIEPTL